MSAFVIIVAAGKGVRLGGGLPKQYRPLCGRPLIVHTIERFLLNDAVNFIQMVIDPEHLHRYGAYFNHPKFLHPVNGGASRQESVHCGLEAIARHRPGHVLIHDGARPFVSTALLDRIMAGLREHDAILPVMRITDTLKEIEGDVAVRDHPRDRLVRAQTPQAFEFSLILDVHRRLRGATFTDDAGMAASLGHAVHIVEGEETNYKVTEQTDIERAERDLAGFRRWRTAQGYDVHRLIAGRPLLLGGIDIPHEKGLEGHSDADVALHALTDAVLGLTASGDIGSHFPPSDQHWKDAKSDKFLIHAVDLLRAADGTLDHVDLTIICEAPKIGPHRMAMQNRIAAMTGLEPEQVSIKATTNEQLGFLGRKEGIAALAVATASFVMR